MDRKYVNGFRILLVLIAATMGWVVVPVVGGWLGISTPITEEIIKSARSGDLVMCVNRGIKTNGKHVPLASMAIAVEKNDGYAVSGIVFFPDYHQEHGIKKYQEFLGECLKVVVVRKERTKEISELIGNMKARGLPMEITIEDNLGFPVELPELDLPLSEPF